MKRIRSCFNFRIILYDCRCKTVASRKRRRAVEEKVKQRLIGVIVIVGALFIILPFLFHNSRPSADTKLSSNIPNPSVSVALPPASTTASTPATTQVTAVTTSGTQLASANAPTTGDVNTQITAPA